MTDAQVQYIIIAKTLGIKGLIPAPYDSSIEVTLEAWEGRGLATRTGAVTPCDLARRRGGGCGRRERPKGEEGLHKGAAMGMDERAHTPSIYRPEKQRKNHHEEKNAFPTSCILLPFSKKCASCF